jgi:hypothetical protein
MGDALIAARFLDFSGSRVLGPVRLMGADIRGGLSFRGCELGDPGEDDVVLLADGIKVDGHVILDSSPERRFTADGSLRLPGAAITGNLVCAGPSWRALTGTAHR